jgi:hypothetical protein
MRGVYARVPEQARDVLFDLAEAEWRDPRDQAGLLLVEALRQRGVLPPESIAPTIAASDGGPGMEVPHAGTC